MIIHHASGSRQFYSVKIWFCLSLIFFIFFIVLIFLSQARLKQIASNFKFKTKELISTNYYRYFTISPEHFDINIAFEDLQKLEKKRQTALDLGILLSSDEDFVPAEIKYQAKKIPVKLRLKGDWIDHLESDKWSFRIQTKNDETIMGMTRFSLQEPSTRGYLNEWLFLRALRQEGLIALRYDFVDVSINGENKGSYAIEEHFSKELIENNERREAPILNFSEDKLWRDRAVYALGEDGGSGYFYDSEITAFRFNKVLADEKLNQEYSQAESLLEQFRLGQLEVKQVFDLSPWAKLLAMSDVFGVKHALAWHNLRFYYNPVTGLLEPIAFDNEPGEHLRALAIEEDPNRFELINLIFSSEELQELYYQNLNKFSQKIYLDNLFLNLDVQLNRAEQLINRDILYKFDKNIFYQNQEFIQQKLADREILQTQELEDSKLKEDQRFAQSSGIPDFIKINFENKTYQISAGNWQLNTDLVIPKNYSLIIEAGANLDLLNQAAIISYGDVHFDGNEDEQITIDSSDRSGQGLLVLSAPHQSSITYTKFNNLTNIKALANNISGAICFYESEILISNSLFENNNSEDMLNIVRSNFEIENSSFANTKFDAVDVDFGRGKISNSRFNNLGNDAIDVSGSEIEVNHVSINKVGDKAVSVGEKSNLKIANCQISNFNIGLASKDSSHLEVRLCSLDSGKVGITAYQKKPEYGPVYVEIWNTQLSNIETSYLIEKNSLFYINNTRQPDDQTDIYSKLYAE